MKETMELLDFAIAATKDVKEAKSDDGKISTIEWFQIIASNAGEAYFALEGIDKIEDEVKAASREDLEMVAKKAMELASMFFQPTAGK